MIALALMAALGAAPAADAAAPAASAAATTLCAVAGHGADGPCPEGGGVTVADLGWNSMECDCSQHISNDWERRWTRFRREPRIDEVRAGSPLRDGDVLVAVDGQSLTSEAGGRKYAQIRPGERVALTVRRDGRTQVVNVTAGARCIVAPVAPRPPRAPRPPASVAAPPAPPAPRGHLSPPPPPARPAAPAPPAAHGWGKTPPTPPTPPAPPTAWAPRTPPTPPAAPAPHAAPVPPTPPTPPTPPSVMPSGWFGFGISCDDCGWAGSRRGATPVWRFRNAPRVESVETGSPAARAGMRRGDWLTHVDGVPLTTAGGGQRFGALRPGQSVRWTFRRGDRSYDAVARAERRPDARPAAARADAQRLRYAGTIGGAAVEVRGAPVTVTRDDRTGETVIRSGDITVRIRPEDGRRERR
jgi:hypothetical protein